MQKLKKVYNLTLEEYLNIYSHLGFKAEIITKKGDECILLSDKDNSPLYIVYINKTSQPLNYDNVKNILIDLELEFQDYNCKNYILISEEGYLNKSNFVKDKKINIYNLQSLNIRLEDGEYIEALIEAKLSGGKYFELNAHNKIAYDNIKKEFEAGNNKVYVRHATGTGKSILVSKYILNECSGNVVILSSSSGILNQFEKHLITYKSGKLKLLTYNKAYQMSETEFNYLKNLNPEFIVLDEFHRCGAKVWGKGVNKLLELCPNSKVLGTSATPVRYLDYARDMGEEMFDSNIVSDIDLCEAIVRGIIPMPTYVIAMYEFEKDLDALKNKVSASKNTDIEKAKAMKMIEALNDLDKSSALIKSAFDKHIGEKRNFVVFCKDYEHMKSSMVTVSNWFTSYIEDHNLNCNINSYELYSSNSNNKVVMEEFKNSIGNNLNNDFNLLFSIEMVNEGIHSRHIDGVILLRPTKSPIVYYQQIGRALHVNPVNIPVVFDFVNNSNQIQSQNFIIGIEEAYEKVDDNTNSVLRELKDVNIFLKDIYDETRDVIAMFNEIEDSLKVEWHAMFDELVKFKNIKGTVIVRASDNEKLYNWVRRNRIAFSKGKLLPERKELLDSIGFVYEAHEYAWFANYQNLKDYKARYNHLNVSEKKHYQLYKFINSQRASYKAGTLSKERIKLLDDIDMIWDVHDYNWSCKYNELVELYNQIGNLYIIDTSRIVDIDGTTVIIDEELMDWIRQQRTYSKMGILRKDREEKLKSLGLALDILKKIRDDNFERLVLFIKNNGHANVKSSDEKRLYNWVKKMRANKKAGKLNDDTIALYDSIGFTWSVREATWDENFSDYTKYMMKYHTPIMEKGDEGYDDTLFKWARAQRTLYNKGGLQKEREDRLNSIGFVWDINEYKWLLHYNELKNYLNSIGETTYNTSLMKQYSGEFNFPEWIKNQKRAFAKDTLSEDRRGLLEELGINFG